MPFFSYSLAFLPFSVYTFSPMKLVISISAILLFFSVVGCTTFTDNISGPGKYTFRDKLSVSKRDADFFIGKYKGHRTNCFPPIDMPVCHPMKGDEDIYTLDKQLNMERFHIYISSYSGDPWAFSLADYLYLVAAELCIQLGYPMFTIIGNTDISLCRSSSIEASTHGTIDTLSLEHGGQFGRYSGTTTVRPIGACVVGKSMDVLFFKDKNDLAKGVLQRSTTYFGEQIIQPLGSLYVGTTPNLDPIAYFGQTDDTLRTTPTNAWKTHYDAAGLMKDLRVKLKIDDFTPYVYTDEREKNKKRIADDPINKNRVIVK